MRKPAPAGKGPKRSFSVRERGGEKGGTGERVEGRVGADQGEGVSAPERQKRPKRSKKVRGRRKKGSSAGEFGREEKGGIREFQEAEPEEEEIGSREDDAEEEGGEAGGWRKDAQELDEAYSDKQDNFMVVRLPAPGFWLFSVR